MAHRGQATFKDLRGLVAFIQALKINIDGVTAIDRQLSKVKKSCADTLSFLLQTPLRPDTLPIFA